MKDWGLPRRAAFTCHGGFEMTAFNRAWDLLKTPYNIVDNLDSMSSSDLESLRPYFEKPYPQGGQHEMLFQGGKEEDDDSTFWTKDRDEALMYALFGSDFDASAMRTGVPQIRVAPKTEDTHDLRRDWETWEVGVHSNLPHQIQSRGDTARQIQDLLLRWQGRDYDHVSEYWSPERMGWDTSARNASQQERIAHIEEQLRRLRE